ncbi:MAG TPA: anti-sigma factor [Acetobacteraceae bacterium]|nr:anti-sigma factor [Acetobacteraceae bacterium]
MTESSEDRDLQAAEYVLGTLDPEAARALARAALSDPLLARAIAEWEQRLAPLGRLVSPVVPPADVWARIEASAWSTSAEGDVVPGRARLARIWRSLGFWRLTTAGAVALAAVLAGLLIVRPAQTPRVMGTIVPTNAAGPVFLAEIQPNGSLLIRALAPVSVAEGKALELWALPAGAKTPMALGLLPPSGQRVLTATTLGNATELMISLEPEGGSPTGKPTGPVLYQGRLARVE